MTFIKIKVICLWCFNVHVHLIIYRKVHQIIDVHVSTFIYGDWNTPYLLNLPVVWWQNIAVLSPWEFPHHIQPTQWLGSGFLRLIFWEEKLKYMKLNCTVSNGTYIQKSLLHLSLRTCLISDLFKMNVRWSGFLIHLHQAKPHVSVWERTWDISPFLARYFISRAVMDVIWPDVFWYRLSRVKESSVSIKIWWCNTFVFMYFICKHSITWCKTVQEHYI